MGYLILLISLTLFGVFISSFSKAIVDLSEEGNIKWDEKYWVKSKSSGNKWKDGQKSKGEKYLGSSTIFVLFTDAWHLFGFINRIGYMITYTSLGILIGMSYWYLFGLLVVYTLFYVLFHIIYTYNMLRK